MTLASLVETMYLGHLKLDTASGFSVCNCEIGKQGSMTDDGRKCVAVLMGQPFTVQLRSASPTRSSVYDTYYFVKSAWPLKPVNYA